MMKTLWRVQSYSHFILDISDREREREKNKYQIGVDNMNQCLSTVYINFVDEGFSDFTLNSLTSVKTNDIPPLHTCIFRIILDFNYVSLYISSIRIQNSLDADHIHTFKWKTGNIPIAFMKRK